VDFFRFPHTPHLAWLGRDTPRDDKVLSPADVAELLSEDVVVEEKVDGANLGFSVSEDGELRAQNRGSYLAQEAAHPQFKPMWPWLASRREQLVDALWPDLYLFGEWCLAVHSLRYSRLPDWFLGFDVYDRAAGRFWDTTRRDALLAQLGLAPVPQITRGRLDVPRLKAMLGHSRLTDGPMEGLVVRREAEGWTTARGKLVNAAFTQAIDAHWSKGALERNAVARPATDVDLQDAR
jgi:hypothetical protein